MNIYALTGHRVTVTKSSISLGTDAYRDIAEKYLTVGALYTVAITHPENSSTSVTLQEFPDVSFKSVSFEDVNSQSEEDDMKHPDWATWNTEEGYRKYLEENS